MGDIVIKLFPDECPKTVENFVTHARNNFYDGVIFHRVIKGFMVFDVLLHSSSDTLRPSLQVQTGDPLGDGTGGIIFQGVLYG